MPFIKTSTNISIDHSKKEILKDRLGRAISIMGKPESYLMLEFDDNREMYFSGSNDPLAFVDVKVLGNANNTNEMTGEITNILSQELNIPANRIYIAYKDYSDWGYNGSNF